MSLDFLSPDHLAMLAVAIDPDVIGEREYTSVSMVSPTSTALAELGVSFQVRAGTGGLIIPMYGPDGRLTTAQFRRDELPSANGARPLRYLSATGMANRLDVHPRNAPRIRDVGVPLWITEGVKKADALTSRGECVVALAGVFNWRERLGTLGDWEDVPLRERQVVVCFDSDASDNRQVMLAMRRLGAWLRSRGADVRYVITPAVEGLEKSGADDYLSNGGDIAGLLAVATSDAPGPTPDGAFSDSYLAEAVAGDVMDGSYVWCSGLGWMTWDGKRWTGCTDEHVIDQVRRWAMAQFASALQGGSAGARTQAEVINSWRAVLGRSRLTAIVSLCRGIVERRAEDFDADPLLVNTPSGVVDLVTGELTKHDPELYLTKMTKGSYKPGYVHDDWEKALQAVPESVLPWLQARFGQAITGRPTPDGVLLVFQGSGENGKSAITTDGPVVALGDYAGMASPKLLSASKGNEHSTEMADLRGQRLLIAEELTEGKSLNVLMIKRIMDVGTIKARYIRQDNITFNASHSLFLTTNYVPVISETDHGTWRRLALVRFPYQFRKPGEPLERPTDRRGDPTLKQRIRDGYGGRHDAIVTWVIQGAISYHADATLFQVPDPVAADTNSWRATADRILGFWQECLRASRGSCIPAVDLFDGFNKWVTENGHNAWSKETFGPRFAQHGETTRHGVSQDRMRSPEGVSLVNPWGQRSTTSLDRVIVWRGVEWDHGPDHVNDQPGQGGQTPSGFAELSSHYEGLPKRSGHPGQGTTVREDRHEESPLRASQSVDAANLETFPEGSGHPGQGVAVFDLETASADWLYRVEPQSFIRIMGWDTPGSPEVRITAEDHLTQVQDLLAAGYTLGGHNISGFDLQALARVGLDLTKLRGKVVCSMIRERLLDPPLSGKEGSSRMPKGYYGLDASCRRRGLPTKTSDLKDLVKVHGGYDQIPLDDVDYRSYLTGDVIANRALLEAQGPLDAYAQREMDVSLITAQMSVNGFRVDVAELDRILAEQDARKAANLDELSTLTGLPMGRWHAYKTKPDEWEEHQAPLATREGKDAIIKAFLDAGLKESAIPRTEKSGDLSTSRESMTALRDRVRRHGGHAKVERLCDLISAVVGERTVYATTQDHLVGDRVHPAISATQASGRWSVTNPGLTVLGKRDGKHVERRIFLPEDGHVLLSVDLDQADARCVAAHSQDPWFMRIFTEGRKDIHAAFAEILFGDHEQRDRVKPVSLGWPYGRSPKAISEGSGIPLEDALSFDAMLRREAPGVVRWQTEVRDRAAAGEMLDTGFGRLMRPDPRFAYTQAPALVGQGCTADIMREGLLKLPTEFWSYLRVIVHDELVLSVPEKDAEEIGREVVAAYTFDFQGVPITAGVSKPGRNWSEVYEK